MNFVSILEELKYIFQCFSNAIVYSELLQVIVIVKQNLHHCVLWSGICEHGTSEGDSGDCDSGTGPVISRGRR